MPPSAEQVKIIDMSTLSPMSFTPFLVIAPISVISLAYKRVLCIIVYE